jgi:hypothetical protein
MTRLKGQYFCCMIVHGLGKGPQGYTYCSVYLSSREVERYEKCTPYKHGSEIRN